MIIPPALKKLLRTTTEILEHPEDVEAVKAFATEMKEYAERRIQNWELRDRMRRVKAQRSEVHERGKKLLKRTNPKGMRGVLLSSGHGPFIRFYAEDKSFKDYDLGWLVDSFIIIDDNDHELKEFEREDGLMLRVFELCEYALTSTKIPILEPGQSSTE
jgi:hypothetical protein